MTIAAGCECINVAPHRVVVKHRRRFVVGTKRGSKEAVCDVTAESEIGGRALTVAGDGGCLLRRCG